MQCSGRRRDVRTVTLESMTGFARQYGRFADLAWRWEVRSVNNRGLDIRMRMPPGHESLEVAARALLGKVFARGSFQLSLTLEDSAGPSAYRLNGPLLEQILAMTEPVRLRIGAPPPRIETLLRLRGVLEPEGQEDSDETRTARDAAMLESLGSGLEALARARREEGSRLAGLLHGFLDTIQELSAQARDLAACQPEAIALRLRTQLDDLMQETRELSEERLAQEIALLASKADIREEIDRLDAHVAQARDLLKGGGAVGRRLDFLSQEFNREANTLCSKTQDLALTRLGLDLKAAIEQFREQVQNLQ